jgi:hypothetical protein
MLFRAHKITPEAACGDMWQLINQVVHQYLIMPSSALGRKRWNSVSSVHAA